MIVRATFEHFFGYAFLCGFSKIEIGLVFCQHSSVLLGYSLHGQIQPLGGWYGFFQVRRLLSDLELLWAILTCLQLHVIFKLVTKTSFWTLIQTGIIIRKKIYDQINIFSTERAGYSYARCLIWMPTTLQITIHL